MDGIGHALALSLAQQRRRFLNIQLRHAGGARFIAEARQHRVLVDQPAEDGATDQGITPAELLLVALGGCLGQHVAQYLRMRDLPAEDLLIRVEAARATRPMRLCDFHVEVIIPGMSERQLQALEKSLPAGIVHNALLRENNIRITVSSADAQQ